MAEIRFNKTVPEGNRAINRIQWQFGQATPIEGLKYGIPSAMPRKINKTDTRAIEIGVKARSRNRISPVSPHVNQLTFWSHAAND